MTDIVALLDVNVPMYAAGVAHPLRDACVWVMAEVAEGQLAVAIDTETIQEILYWYGALRRWDIATSMATSLLDLVPTVYPVTAADVHTAVALYGQYASRGVKARDVMHAAVMRGNGLSAIISCDEHFDQIEGLRRIDPRALFERGRGSSG